MVSIANLDGFENSIGSVKLLKELAEAGVFHSNDARERDPAIDIVDMSAFNSLSETVKKELHQKIKESGKSIDEHLEYPSGKFREYISIIDEILGDDAGLSWFRKALDKTSSQLSEFVSMIQNLRKTDVVNLA